jgi:tetratricopeptide (TPR) repeat protein
MPRVDARSSSPRGGRTVLGRLLVAVAALVVTTVAHGQVFSAERYLQECLRFEVGGDYTTARGSCLNALQAEPGMVAAELALGRIELELGELGQAQTRLQRIRSRIDSPEPVVLLAEIAYRSGNFEDAATFVATARAQLERDADVALSARIAYLAALLATREGRFDDALLDFERAIALDGLEVSYRLADASLRFRLGDTSGARQQLQHYTTVSGDDRNADIVSLQGRVLWAEGSLGEAVDRLETALALRSLRDSSAQSDDLRALAVLYYAQGDLESGGLALREAMRRGNLMVGLSSNFVIWLLAIVLLLGLHLVGESRQSGLSAAPDASQPRPWSVGQAYGILVLAAFAGLAGSLAYSVAVFGNLFALLTPLQGQDARAVYFIVFVVVAAALAWQRVRRAGFDPAERLLGRSEGLAPGLLAGLGIAGVALAYFAFTERSGIFGDFFLDLTRPTTLTVVALALIPLAEVSFRGFLYPALARRYDPTLAVFVTGLAWAVAFGAPLILLAVIGIGLTALYRARRNGVMLVSAVLVGWTLLLVAAAVSPAVRSLLFI